MNDEAGSGREPGEVPPRPRLDRPPSDRFGRVAEAPPDSASGPNDAGSAGAPRPAISLSRGTGPALAVGAIGALALTVVYGVLATTIGLLAIAVATGWVAGLALRGSEGAALRAVTLAIAAVLVGIIGGWAVSLLEGGVAGPFDYVGQTLGPLAVVMPILAAGAAWLGSR